MTFAEKISKKFTTFQRLANASKMITVGDASVSPAKIVVAKVSEPSHACNGMATNSPSL